MNAPIEQVAEDLKKYLLTKYRTQREMANRIGVSYGHISNYLGGKERISHNVADRIHELHPEVSVAYLLTGEGSLLSPGNIQHLERVNNSGNIVNGGSAALAVENAQLREQLAQVRAEKDRLLGIIETLTSKP